MPYANSIDLAVKTDNWVKVSNAFDAGDFTGKIIIHCMCGLPCTFPEIIRFIMDIDVQCPTCGKMIYINSSPGR